MSNLDPDKKIPANDTESVHRLEAQENLALQTLTRRVLNNYAAEAGTEV